MLMVGDKVLVRLSTMIGPQCKVQIRTAEQTILLFELFKDFNVGYRLQPKHLWC